MEYESSTSAAIPTPVMLWCHLDAVIKIYNSDNIIAFALILRQAHKPKLQQQHNESKIKWYVCTIRENKGTVKGTKCMYDQSTD